jgi:hypothetical protein
MEQVDGVKSRLSRLRLQYEELMGVIERATAEYEAVLEPATATATAESDPVLEPATAKSDDDAVVNERDALAEYEAVMLPARWEREQVLAKMALAESELDALVSAPVSGDRDPFEWLPDELIMIIRRCGVGCASVCVSDGCDWWWTSRCTTKKSDGRRTRRE